MASMRASCFPRASLLVSFCKNNKFYNGGTMKTLFLTAALFGSSFAAHAQEATLPLTKVVEVEKDTGDLYVFANPFGQSLYIFDPDSAVASNCNGDCAEK